MMRLTLWLLVFVGSLSGSALSVLRASRQPIALNLRRVAGVSRNASASSSSSSAVDVVTMKNKPVRSVPLLFQQLLGIVPGEPFHFDLNRWRVIQNCGLFANLTARTVSRNGTVSLIISGDELPAITFAPEFSVGASITRPEVSGGMLFRDNNFRGLGDRVEVIVSAFNNQGLEGAGLAELLPRIHLKWIDGIRGRPSSVSVAVDSDHSIEDLANLVPRCAAAGSKERRQVGADRVSASFQGRRGGYSYEVEPYNLGLAVKTTTRQTLVDRIRLSGAKLRYALPFIELLYDGGIMQVLRPPEAASTGISRKYKKNEPPTKAAAPARYHRAALDITSPAVLLYDLESNATTSASALQVLGVAKWRIMKAWGPGCLPLYHFSSIEDTNYIRGFNFAPKVPFYSILKVPGSDFPEGSRSFLLGASQQLSYPPRFSTPIPSPLSPDRHRGQFDAFLQGLHFGTPGIFIDAGRFHRISDRVQEDVAHSQQQQEVTAGFSVKSHGLRVDVGFPSFRLNAPKIHLNLDV